MLDRIFTPDKIRHLCTCRSDRDLTISLFTRPSPIKNMRPATCETRICTKNISRARRLELFFNCRLIALKIIAQTQHLLWGCIAPTLHGLRGYGWLKLYREWWEGSTGVLAKGLLWWGREYTVVPASNLNGSLFTKSAEIRQSLEWPLLLSGGKFPQ